AMDPVSPTLTQLVQTAFGGMVATQVLEGERSFDLAVRLRPETIGNLDEMRAIPLFGSNNEIITFGQVADVKATNGFAEFIARRMSDASLLSSRYAAPFVLSNSPPPRPLARETFAVHFGSQISLHFACTISKYCAWIQNPSQLRPSPSLWVGAPGPGSFH